MSEPEKLHRSGKSLEDSKKDKKKDKKEKKDKKKEKKKEKKAKKEKERTAAAAAAASPISNDDAKRREAERQINELRALEEEFDLPVVTKRSPDLDAQRRTDEAARRAVEERQAEEARRLESARRAEEARRAEDEARRRADDEARARADQARRQQLLEERERERQREMSTAWPAPTLPVTAYVSAIARAPLPTRSITASLQYALPQTGISTADPVAFTISTTGDAVARNGAVQVQVSGSDGRVVNTTVSSAGDRHTATYTPLVGGNHDVQVVFRLNTNVDIITGTDNNLTKVYGPGVEDGPRAGEPTHFTVEAIGTDGKRIPRGGDPFAVQVTGPKGESIPANIKDNGDGTYHVEYTPLNGGPTKIAVTLRDKPVAKSPYVINVNDYTADPMFTKAWGPGLQGAVTGEPTEFYIQATNKDGKPIPIGGENFRVLIDGPSGPSTPPVIDNGDGTYKVKYTVDKPGPHKIQVDLKTDRGKGPWAPIQNSPFTVNVSPAAADPNKTRVFGPGIEDGNEAGKPTYFNIEARDNKGDKLPWGGDPFVVQITTPKGNVVDVPVRDNGDGTYRVDYTPTYGGPTKIAVTLRGKPVANSPYTINVKDNIADPMFTKAWGPGLQGAVTGEPTEFYIKAHNKDGVPIPIGGENFKVQIDGPSGISNPPVVDNGDGTYTVKYQANKPGPHKIQVDLKTDRGKGPWAPIQNSPFTVNITPAAADPDKTRVFGPGIEDGNEAGKPTYFNIEARDNKGDKLPWGGDPFQVEITTPKGEKVNVPVKDNGDGTYRVDYTPTSGGPTKIAVTLRGKPVAKSPYTINVKDNIADPMFTKAWGPGLQGAVTGEPTEFYIKAHNKDGVPIPIGGENFKVQIDGPSGISNPPVVDNGDGTYTVKYAVGKPGPHKIQVDLKTDRGKGPWAPIQNSPFTVNVTPMPANAANSRVFGPGIEDGNEAGKPTYFNIEARDNKGDRIPWGGDPFEVEITGPKGEKIRAPVKDNGDGTYRVDYTPLRGGPTKVAVTLRGQPVANSPYLINIRDQAADPMFSKAWGPGLERAESGLPTEFYIKAYNSSGEPLPIGGENWEVTISGSTNGTMKPPVRDNGDGTYTVRYMAPNPGQIQIAVSLKTDRGRGPWAPLKDSPFLVNVAATPADANLSRVFGPGIEDGVEAGIPTFFNIEARDGKGDRIPWGGDPFEVEITGPKGEKIRAPVKDNGDGTYRVDYTPLNGGPTKIAVTLRDKPVARSPYHINVRDPTADPMKTKAWGPGLERARVGTPTEFYIKAYNSIGMPIPVGGENFRVVIEGPLGAVPATVHDNNDGTYTVRYKPDEIGPHTIRVDLKTERGRGPYVPIQGSPWTVHASPPAKKTKANFEGIVTLRTAEESRELVQLIDHLVHHAVDVFYEMQSNPKVVDNLLRDLRRTTELCSTFPPLCLAEEDRRQAGEVVSSMQRSEQTIRSLFSQVQPGQPMPESIGKRLTPELRTFLARMVDITQEMDREQVKRILRSTKKAFEVCLIMKDTTSDFRFEQKAATYDANMEVLIKLIDTRIEVIDNPDHIKTLTDAIAVVKDRKQLLVDNTVSSVRNPTQDNIGRQQNDLREMLTAISNIANVMQLPPPKSKYGLDHEQVVVESLDALSDAVRLGQGALAAEAARKLADELAKMQAGNIKPEEEDDEAARRAREALQRAANNLKDRTGGLLRAAKGALQNPNDKDALKSMQDILDGMKGELRGAVVSTEYDRIETSLVGSGLIDAAAETARKLEKSFQ